MNKFYLAFLFVLISGFAFSQTGTVRGFVFDDGTGEPVIFTNVYLEGTTYGSSTDINGYYSISKVPPGTYTLVVSSLGYTDFKEEIQIKRDVILDKKVMLSSGAIEIGEVTVSAERQESRSRVQMSVTSVSQKEIQLLPSVGGSPDIAQYMQVIPGIVFTGDQGGQLYIRGGSPVQNKVTLDGMTIMQPFHSIGLYSVFDTEIMKNADVFTGGFGAQYGGRISSVLDITTRDGNKYEHSGNVGINTFGAKVSLEGPLKKPKNDNDGSITYVLSAKNSYLDKSSEIFYPYIDNGNLPFQYGDIYGKVSFGSANGTKLNLQGFSFNDQVKFNDNSSLKWVNWGAGANFVLVPSTSAVLLEGRFNYSKYKIELDELDYDTRSSIVTNFMLGLDMKYFIAKNELRYGFEISGYGTDFSYFNSFGFAQKQVSNTTDISGYALYRFLVANDKLVFDAGFRFIYYSSIAYISPEPRLGVKYNVTPKFRLKASAGLYSQNLVATNSDRDVVNLFFGYVTSPEEIPSAIINQDGTLTEINKSVQKASHLIAGFEYDLFENISFNVEGYYKNYGQLINANRFKIFDAIDTDKPDYLRADYLVETGTVYGVDFIMKYADRVNFIWIVYSYGKSDRWDGFQEYNPVYDRRNNINIVASRKLGKTKTWEINARWNFGSGFPFTQTAGFYEGQPLNGGINTNITTSNSDVLSYLLAGLNEGRLPSYSRLDIGVKKTFEFSPSMRLVLDFSLTNAYDRQNVFYVDRFTSEIFYQLPILPAVGLNFYF
jgi:hypothetical protein